MPLFAILWPIFSIYPKAARQARPTLPQTGETGPLTCFAAGIAADHAKDILTMFLYFPWSVSGIEEGAGEVGVEGDTAEEFGFGDALVSGVGVQD